MGPHLDVGTFKVHTYIFFVSEVRICILEVVQKWATASLN